MKNCREFDGFRVRWEGAKKVMYSGAVGGWPEGYNELQWRRGWQHMGTSDNHGEIQGTLRRLQNSGSPNALEEALEGQ